MNIKSNIGLKITEISDSDFTIEKRLLRFYEKYCPDKICHIDKIISKYSKNEKELFKGLASKYGKEPEMTLKEKDIVKKRLIHQQKSKEEKNKHLEDKKLKKIEEKKRYLDIYTYPYDDDTLLLLKKISDLKGKELPKYILEQI